MGFRCSRNAGTVENDFGFYAGTLFEKFGLIHKGGPRFYEPETGLRLSARTNQSGSKEPAVGVLAAFVVAGVFLTARFRKRSALLRASVVGVVVVMSALVIVVGGCTKRDSTALWVAPYPGAELPPEFTVPWEPGDDLGGLPDPYAIEPSRLGNDRDKECCQCYEYKLQVQYWDVIVGVKDNIEEGPWKNVPKGGKLDKWKAWYGWSVPFRARFALKRKENPPKELCCSECWDWRNESIKVVFPLSDYAVRLMKMGCLDYVPAERQGDRLVDIMRSKENDVTYSSTQPLVLPHLRPGAGYDVIFGATTCKSMTLQW